jgi:hypothetical protein
MSSPVYDKNPVDVAYVVVPEGLSFEVVGSHPTGAPLFLVKKVNLSSDSEPFFVEGCSGFE